MIYTEEYTLMEQDLKEIREEREAQKFVEQLIKEFNI